MTFDESARIAIASAIILALAYVVSVTGPQASAFAVIITGLAILLIVYRRTPEETAPPTSAPDLNSSASYEAVLDAIADPLMLLLDARVIHANAAAHALFGDRVEGQDIRLAIRHPAIAAMLNNPKDIGVAEISGLGSDPRIWEVRVQPTDDNRRLVHMVDRSARHSAERARVDFVANASHELRTPLANISGYAETLADDAAGGDATTRARFLSIIASETRRLSALVEDLMSLSRIEADKHHEPEAIIDLRQLAQSVISERREPIALDAIDAPYPIKGDRAQMSQLIHNLIDNAVKYGRPDGSVTVKVMHSSNDRICLSIIDEGVGIAAEHIPRLTERFYRVDQARSQLAGGTGLGLSIVKHIAERHRAALEITSEIGTGTTVSATFDAAVT